MGSEAGEALLEHARFAMARKLFRQTSFPVTLVAYSLVRFGYVPPEAFLPGAPYEPASDVYQARCGCWLCDDSVGVSCWLLSALGV